MMRRGSGWTWLLSLLIVRGIRSLHKHTATKHTRLRITSIPGQPPKVEIIGHDGTILPDHDGHITVQL